MVGGCGGTGSTHYRYHLRDNSRNNTLRYYSRFNTNCRKLETFYNWLGLHPMSKDRKSRMRVSLKDRFQLLKGDHGVP